MALSFFTGLRRSATDEYTYLRTAAAYVRRICGFGAAAWFDSAAGAAARPVQQEGLRAFEAEGLMTALATACAFDTQDVLIPRRGRTEIFHVFTCRRSDRLTGLAIGRLDAQLDLQSIDAARAAVCAVHADSAAPDAGQGVHDQALFEVMSATEREILQQLCRGLADKEIARARGVSLQTVKNQVKRILEKAGAERRTELPAEQAVRLRPSRSGETNPCNTREDARRRSVAPDAQGRPSL